MTSLLAYSWNKSHRCRGMILPVILVLFLVVVVYALVMLNHYGTQSVLVRQYDESRRDRIWIEYVSELWTEALYDQGDELELFLVQELVKAGVPSGASIELTIPSSHLAKLPPLAYGPGGWERLRNELGWPLLSEEGRAEISLENRRWMGITGPVAVGPVVAMEVSGNPRIQGSVRWWGRPLLIPLTHNPFLPYDLRWEGFIQTSVAFSSIDIPSSTAWESVSDHLWTQTIPYRLRTQTHLRQGWFSRFLDPDVLQEWLAGWLPLAAPLDFSQSGTIDELAAFPGVISLDEQTLEIDLAQFPVDHLVVYHGGLLRLTGQRTGVPLTLVALPGESGSPLHLVMGDGAEGDIGPLFLVGITSWRSASANPLVVSVNAPGQFFGGALLGPGAELQAAIRGHLSLHAPLEVGYQPGDLPPVTSVTGEGWAQTMATVSPALLLWETGWERLAD